MAIDLPPVSSPRAMELSPEVIKDLGLGDADVIAANAVFVRLRADWATRVRGWYIEATGDAAGADALSADAMGRELQDKAIPGEPAAVQRRLAQERAGLVAPPADLSKASPFERYFRALADHGNEAERMLGGAIGPERAHQVRRHDGGWPMRMTIAGCDDEDGARTP
ncbi:MAG: hypothetical protein IPL61_02690 [Myxococcales bacterium]|nr:hypothetical protein [Myxococcales bacterium]